MYLIFDLEKKTTFFYDKKFKKLQKKIQKIVLKKIILFPKKKRQNAVNFPERPHFYFPNPAWRSVKQWKYYKFICRRKVIASMTPIIL